MASNTRKLTSRLSYAFGAFGHDMFYNTLSVYFIMFVTAHLFDKAGGGENNRMIFYITTIIFLLRFVELAIDPFIGNTIDTTNTRWGHFKPWILIGGTIGSITIAILFTNMGGLNASNPLLYLIIFAVLYICMDIFYSFKDVGFWSMIPAISFDTREREKTATFARVGSTIGANIVGVFVMPLVLMFSINKNHGQGDLRGWFVFGLTIALISWISTVVVGLGTKESKTDLRKNVEKTSFKDVFKVLGRNDQLMWLSLTYGLYTAAIQITNSLELYYFTYILGKPAEFTSLATLNTIIGVFAVLAFPPLAQKFSRKNVFFLSIGILIIATVLFAFSGQSLPLVLTAAVLFYIPQPLIFLVVLMIISDSVEYGQLKFGHRDESLTLSVRPLLDKLGGAVSNGVAGLTAVLAGMTAGVTAHDVTSHGQLIFKIMMFGIPAVLILIGTFVFYKKITLDEKQHEEIVNELERTWHKHLENGNESTSDLKEGINHLFKTITYISPVDGTLELLEKVSDAKFSSGIMGKGFAVKPSGDGVYAPFDGTIEATFPTRHAIGLRSDSGILALIHIGIDTVSLNGNGFTQYVDKGERVKQGDKLIEFSSELINKADLDDTVMVVITNYKDVEEFQYIKKFGNVKHGDAILELSAPKR
ncbi:glycoside-pentoside-hexuronide (GPH):cation symporter [Sporolactobacillus shoreicorticis]|uniref:Glycoside-pentoside-hexuronide (GPH):cation symporter n=1 Tax=Sporolactobacillus shoreicorticis TaxID=1923877 RepID=A0ABW5S1T4_9BACL|nr:glycoside-pentoside-hexuronide (GPH):cation symporter [Sporolactobacillus shoreicorticis]MCO7127858.1 glycoside-pentoside-hexuronide (GPH):cation symporter [Sporolactobacillus shoreicorticis]